MKSLGADVYGLIKGYAGNKEISEQDPTLVIGSLDVEALFHT